MQALRNTFERLVATLMFFTRLPLARLGLRVDGDRFKHVVPLWPLAGWLTGGVMAGVYVVCRHAGLTVGISVVVALIGRVLLTGALHEDGLADFCDGFGGGRTREMTLAIMKDSHIGTYGVLGLIGYFLLQTQLLSALLTAGMPPLMLVAADAVSKMVASTIVWFLPYARPAAEAKNQLVYSSTLFFDKVLSLLLGLLPLVLMIVFIGWQPVRIAVALAVGIGVSVLLFLLMHKRIGGYTGDCCGATFLLVELTFYLILNVG